jgi:uncharacterized membrane protein YqhA
MVERIFQSSRLLVFIAVFATALSSLVIYLSCINIVFHMVQDIVFNFPSSTKQGKMLAVEFLKLLDLLLIGITLQVIAVSLYRLFITPIKLKESQFLSALNIKDFHDLKITLIQVASVILVILFLEHAVELGGSLEILYLGAAIGIVMAASTFAWRSMK